MQDPLELASLQGQQNDLSRGESSDEFSPLTITLGVGSVAQRYCHFTGVKASPLNIDITRGQTIADLRNDILQGHIPKESRVTFETRSANVKPRIREGRLIDCVNGYPQLSEIYTPVKRFARTGFAYGAGIGIALQVALFGIVLLSAGSNVGLAFIALPLCFLIAGLGVSNKVSIPSPLQTLSMLGSVIIPGYLGLNGMFPSLLGAVVGGAVLFCAPGMTIGAVVGAFRRTIIPRAYDAPKENVVVLIAIPLALSAVVWIACFTLAKDYLLPLLNR